MQANRFDIDLPHGRYTHSCQNDIVHGKDMVIVAGTDSFFNPFEVSNECKLKRKP